MSPTINPLIFGALLFIRSISSVSSYADTEAFFGQNNVVNCLQAHSVPFSTADTDPSNWTSITTPYNLRLIWEPSVVTLPTTPEHVSFSVTCAAASGLKVQAKSGGHSYASFSSGGKNGSLIVDLRAFNTIEVDDETEIATVGTGVRLGNLALGLFERGERAVPHGVCPGVGIGGHFTHGGYGYPARLWGLALDSVVGLDVVLANGSYIYTNDTQYPEIYYAMRGAADSFGIVTYFHLQTHPAPSSIIDFDASFTGILDDPNALANAFIHLQKTAVDPTYMSGNLSFSVYTNQAGHFTIRGWCIECEMNWFDDVTFPKLLEGFPVPSKRTVSSKGYIDSLVRLAEGVPLEVPYDYDLKDTFSSKSIVTKTSKPLSRKQWLGYWTFIKEKRIDPPSPWYSIIDLYGGAGSRINVPSSDSSSFVHRDVLWVIQNNAYTKDHKPPFLNSINTFLTEFNQAIPEDEAGEFGIYLNCVDPELSPTEAALRGYGAETYNRLLAIKREVDPDFLFWNPQAIGNVGPFAVDHEDEFGPKDELR